MLQVRNNAALNTPVSITAAETVVPFDTVVLNTNEKLELKDNKIYEKVSGIYRTFINVNLYNSDTSSVTVTLKAYADDKAIAGAVMTAVIPASSKVEITLPWHVKIVNSNNGVAHVHWTLTGGAASILNAIAEVNAVV